MMTVSFHFIYHHKFLDLIVAYHKKINVKKYAFVIFLLR